MHPSAELPLIAFTLFSQLAAGIMMISPFTLLNAGSSWLSREILLVLLVCATLAASVFLAWKRSERRLSDWLYYTSAALGIILLYAMSRVYNSPFTPGWAGGQTFFISRNSHGKHRQSETPAFSADIQHDGCIWPES